jgi:hypothetical protein
VRELEKQRSHEESELQALNDRNIQLESELNLAEIALSEEKERYACGLLISVALLF